MMMLKVVLAMMMFIMVVMLVLMMLMLMRALMPMLMMMMMINSQFTLFRPLNRVLRAFLDARLEFLLLQRDCHQSVVCALIEESLFVLFFM